ncbi:MAG TPA: GxxExxY protein [bacterium]|nr:GxxExxY protein [bacterium]
MTTEYKHKDVTETIIKAFYKVYNTLGYGFLEKVYENALFHELKKIGFEITRQVPISVYCDGIIMGEYFADIMVNNLVIIEIKAVERLTKSNSLQLINYLKANKIEVGLLLNFGEKPQITRKVYTNK